MKTIERVYDVLPNFDFSVGDKSGSVDLFPSPDLISELREFPRGSMVVVDIAPEYLYADSPNFEVAFEGNQWSGSLMGYLYIQRLRRVCEDSGLKLIPIGDSGLWEKSVIKRLQANMAQQKFDEINNKLNYDFSRREAHPGLRRWLEAAFAYRAEADYIDKILQSEHMAREIIDLKPDVIVSTDKLAFFLYSHREALQVRGIGLGNLRLERMPERTVMHDGLGQSEPLWFCTVLEDDNPNDVIGDWEETVRTFNAVSQKRILPEAKPSIIGTRTIHNRFQGLFEIYLDYDTGEGFIEDASCRSPVKIDTKGNGLVLVEIYDPEVCGDDVVPFEPLVYKLGVLKNGMYRGEWQQGPDSHTCIAFPGSRFLLSKS